ncbi:MAG TPA: GatB/YqeY domain-containing protein [Gammaproteobacteria bacterium]|nr:GatB/YqeY domain-containing protein [Gammaproteobacteria bacterium]
MSESSLKHRLQEDMKTALKAKEKERLGTIRLILAAIKQREIDERITLDDAAVLAVLDKAAKQRRESIQQYAAAHRQDLVEQEQTELAIIESYLPEKLDEATLQTLVRAAISESGAASVKDMGKVMAILKPQVQGRVDMTQLGATIKALLNQPN